MTIISPSIMAADFSKLGRELTEIRSAGADMVHVDVMDGCYVPSITFGDQMVAVIKKHSDLPIDVHLMIQYPEKHIETYAAAGASLITIHPNSTKHLHRTIVKIKSLGCKAGIALLPSDNLEILKYIIDEIDLLLIMSVNPGFGGQTFIKSQLQKIQDVSQMIEGHNILLSVDGGINQETAKLCIQNGANMLVSGSYIFNGNYKENIARLKG